MLLQSLGLLKNLLHKDRVVIDDPVFKLHYGFTTYLLLFMSILVTGKVYFGDPIQCSLYYYEFDKVLAPSMLNTYCYIHSTFIVPTTTAFSQDLVYKYHGVGPYHPTKQNDELVFQSYYQWTGLLLFLQGCSFFLPQLLWKSLENGVINGLQMQLQNPSAPTDQIERNLLQLIDYLKRSVNHRGYGQQFMFCHILNLLILIAQIVLTNVYLAKNFLSYGVQFSYSYADANYSSLYQDTVFPKMSKCNMHIYGPSGSLQNFDGLCVLPLNIIHDKIYLILWFWFILLLLLSLGSSFFWMWMFIRPYSRLRHLERQLNTSLRGNRLKYFNQCFGDWFLLHQLGKNMELHNFRRLIYKLCSEDSKPLIEPRTSLKGEDEPQFDV